MYYNSCKTCQIYPKNGPYDSCCIICSKNPGSHCDNCTRKMNNLYTRESSYTGANAMMCYSCRRNPTNLTGNYCCGSCRRSNGKVHSTTCSPNVIEFYDSDAPYYEFTNFHNSGINMYFNDADYYFPTSEHYFQAFKYVKDPNWKTHLLAILSLTNPSDVPNYARNNIVCRDYKFFDTIKDNVMYIAVLAKVKQNPHISNMLKQTGDAVLVEDSPYDEYWGIGANGHGMNMLGKILMHIRSLI